jgi:hypothetical protein
MQSSLNAQLSAFLTKVLFRWPKHQGRAAILVKKKHFLEKKKKNNKVICLIHGYG